MSIKTFEKEELKEMSMIEIAFELLKEGKKPIAFKDMFAQVAEAKELTKEQQDERIANLYTDLNVDGRFINIGENQWGLKKWYPIERIEDELSAKPSKKRAAKSKEEDEDYDIDLEDELLEDDELEDLEDEDEEVGELEEDEDEEFLEDGEDDEKLDGFEDEEFEEDEEIDEEY